MKRRSLVQQGALVLTLGLLQRSALAGQNATILTVRVWPAPEYSRVTIESDAALSATQTQVGSAMV